MLALERLLAALYIKATCVFLPNHEANLSTWKLQLLAATPYLAEGYANRVALA